MSRLGIGDRVYSSNGLFANEEPEYRYGVITASPKDAVFVIKFIYKDGLYYGERLESDLRKISSEEYDIAVAKYKALRSLQEE